MSSHGSSTVGSLSLSRALTVLDRCDFELEAKGSEEKQSILSVQPESEREWGEGRRGVDGKGWLLGQHRLASA